MRTTCWGRGGEASRVVSVYDGAFNMTAVEHALIQFHGTLAEFQVRAAAVKTMFRNTPMCYVRYTPGWIEIATKLHETHPCRCHRKYPWVQVSSRFCPKLSVGAPVPM